MGYFQWYGMSYDTGGSLNGWDTANYGLPVSTTSSSLPANRSREGQMRFNTDTNLSTGFYSVGIIRFRHAANTKTNMMFVDGHVEAREVGTVLARDVSVDIPTQ